MLGVIFLSLFTTSCSENNVNSNQNSQEYGEEFNLFDSRAELYEIVSLSLTESLLSSKAIIISDEKEIQSVFNIIKDKYEFIGEIKATELDDHIICDSVNLGITAYAKELDKTMNVSYLISQDGVLYYYISNETVKYTNENAIDYLEIVEYIRNK